MGVFEFIAIIVIGGTIAKALAKRISAHPASVNPDLRGLLEQTEQRLYDTEQRLVETNERLADMEERLDFTERMLTRQNAREQLEP